MTGLARWQRIGRAFREWLIPNRERPKLRRRTVLTVEQLEDRLTPATVDFAVTNDWGSGFQANLTINNAANASPVADWQLQFNYSANISSIWDAKIVSHVGTEYVIDNAGWNSTIAPGGNVSFGFVASPGNTTAQPTDYLLNGLPLDDTQPPPPPPPPASGNVSFTVQSDWGSGFTGQVTVSNPGTTPIANWSLAFTFAGQISSIWNASVSSRSGDQYVVQPASWDGTIPAGGSVSFGFNGSPGGSAAVPTNFVLNGESTSGTTNQAPTAGNASAATLSGVPVTTNVLANASDTDGDTVSLASVTQGKDGTVTANSNGTVTYTPTVGFTGTDAFSYTVSDGHGNNATGTVAMTVTAIPPPVASPGWPAQVFAPYVDATDWPIYNFLQVAQTQGTKFFNLAFVVAGPNNEPAWGGYQTYDVVGSSYSANLQAEIAALRQIGGDVAVSFGGAANQELAEVIPTVSALQAAYQTVINTYNLTHIDFDIEGAAQGDQAAIDRRSQAILGLEQAAAAAGRQLVVSFTLPILPTGLTAEGLNVLTSALKDGVTVNLVNIMAMDYGDSAAPNPAGQMGTYAIDAANSLFTQLTAVYGTQKSAAQIWSMIGVTVMIGVNDISDEIFTQSNAQQLLAFAQQVGLGEISMWSLNRDRPGTPAYDVSGVNTANFDFSNIFETYTK